MLQSLLLAALALTHLLNIWHLIILSFVQGLINALDLPTRQALLPEMVAQKDLDNAIALNASLLGVARLIGPALAGVLMLGVVLIIFAQSRILWLSLGAIAFIGFFLIIGNAASSTMLLSIVDEDKRGRVMGIYTVASDAIMIPCGNLFAGALAPFHRCAEHNGY